MSSGVDMQGAYRVRTCVRKIAYMISELCRTVRKNRRLESKKNDLTHSLSQFMATPLRMSPVACIEPLPMFAARSKIRLHGVTATLFYLR